MANKNALMACNRVCTTASTVAPRATRAPPRPAGRFSGPPAAAPATAAPSSPCPGCSCDFRSATLDSSATTGVGLGSTTPLGVRAGRGYFLNGAADDACSVASLALTGLRIFRLSATVCSALAAAGAAAPSAGSSTAAACAGSSTAVAWAGSAFCASSASALLTAACCAPPLGAEEPDSRSSSAHTARATGPGAGAAAVALALARMALSWASETL
mmetsp:Transcript_20750/g.32544  ORF Transcript_20750/g.32544 Transcript_20750/m.32544 type:complete len:215 (+) Transcript_20750:441-1085(+)